MFVLGRTKFRLLLAVLSLIIITAIWKTIKDSNKEIPTIYPFAKAFKIKPENQLGNLSSNIDRDVYDSFGKSAKINDTKKSINLLPEPEQPISIAEPPKNRDVFNVITEEGDLPELFTPAPARERELTDKSHGSGANSIVTKDQGENSIWDNIEEALGDNYEDKPISVAEEAKAEVLIDEELKPSVSEMKVLKITNLDKDKVQEDKRKTLVKKTQIYRSQIAYKRTIAEAEQEWQKLFSLHKKLLEKYKYEIIRDQKSKSVFYQLVVGKFNNFSEAKQLCRKLINNKMSCIVVKE